MRPSTAAASRSPGGTSMRSLSPDVAAPSSDGGILAIREPTTGVAAIRLPYLVRVMGPAAVIEDVPIGAVDERPDGGLHLAGRGARFEATATWSPPRGSGRLRDGDVEVTSIDPAGGDAGLVVAVRLSPTDTARWLIPGLFYGQNRLPA